MGCILASHCLGFVFPSYVLDYVTKEMVMDFDEVMNRVLKVFPNAQLSEDSDGQLIVCTNLHPDSQGNYVDMGHEAR